MTSNLPVPQESPDSHGLCTAAEGLSTEQVAQQRAAGLNNCAVASPTKTPRQIFTSNIFTYFNLIFCILAAALISVGSFRNLTFMFVVIINTAIGIVQEFNAKRMLDKLSFLSAPHAAVIRSGIESQVALEELVQGDVVVFSAGNQIYADATVLTGTLQVNESLITGESDEIEKQPGDPLTSGSFVVSGACKARLDRVGAESFVSKLMLESKQQKHKPTPGMMLSLTRLVQIIGILIIPLGGVMVWQYLTEVGLPLKGTIEATTAALIGMIPEGLYLLTNVALAASVIRLAQKKTLVHQLNCIETLARVDTLCVDKTGTITSPEMEVLGAIPLSPRCPETELRRLIGEFAGNSQADTSTMVVLKDAFPAADARNAISVRSFSSVKKTSSVRFSQDEEYVLGAPERILEDSFPEVTAKVNELAASGVRVLLLASTAHELEPLGLIALGNPIRENALETFRFFAQQGVTIKVISGDAPLTVSAAAQSAGIENASDAIDCSALTTESELREAAEKYTVFGRVTPEQKRTLICAMKGAGHTVGMTGDGVNDVLALKEAHCSIAMASGSEVACQISDLVLLNSDFSAMPSVVDEGRRVINNIQRSASLFLVKNIYSFIIAIISIFASFAFPLSPSQMSLISSITIGVPAFVLAMEPNRARIRGKFLPTVISHALPAAIADLFCIIGIVMFADAFQIPRDMSSTIVTYLIVIVGFSMIYRISQPLNLLRVFLLIFLVILLLAAVTIVPTLFSISALDRGGWLVLGVFALLGPIVYFACERLGSQIKCSALGTIPEKMRKFRNRGKKSA